jgi:sulfatase-like protein
MNAVRIRLIVGSRVLTALFFVGTTVYGLLAASSFAYHQFIRPGLFAWLVWAARDFRYLVLGVVSVMVLTLAADPGVRRLRNVILAFATVTYSAAIALLVSPGFSTHGNPETSLTLAALALIVPLWLAAIDHFVSWRTVFNGRTVAETSESRIFATAFVASIYVWALYAAIAVLRGGASSRDLSWFAAAGASLVVHATAFAALAWFFVAMGSVARMTPSQRLLEYLGALALFSGWVFALLERSVLPSLALRGTAASLVAAAISVTIAACWSGIALRLAAADPHAPSGLELFFRPIAAARTTLGSAVGLLIIAVAAFAFVRAAAPIDWGFLLQKVSVFVVWMATWGTLFTATRTVTGLSRRTAIVSSLLVVFAYQAGRVVDARASVPDATGGAPVAASIERWAAYDASFRVLDDAMSGHSEASPEFYRLLSAHANVDRTVRIAPKQIELGPPLTRSVPRRPDIFLFIVDSLRRDYVSAYNPDVTFTPNIGAFAAESLVFRNAFTRYGGTGLAVPSIFSGSLLPHRQYVLPFAPMNALGRLLQSEGYRFAMSVDSVVGELAVPPAAAIVLRSGRGPTIGDMCDTLADLQQVVASQHTERPLFAYALPQNVHVSYVASQPRPQTRYPGFHAPTAAQIARLDACFGEFIRFLKSHDRFDDSLIVVTADHGDSLGEDGRWGHGAAGFPEIFRIPLIVHLPSDMRGWKTDLSSVAFSTDIAPSIYTLLGGRPEARTRLFGSSLLSEDGDTRGRRQEDYLVASSYGPVFGLLTANGHNLYVVDAINGREYAFDLTDSNRRMSVTTAERERAHRRIAEQILEVSTFFGYQIPQ